MEISVKIQRVDPQIDVQVIKKYVSKNPTSTFKGRSHICSNGDDYCTWTIIALKRNWNTGTNIGSVMRFTSIVLFPLQIESKGTVAVSLWRWLNIECKSSYFSETHFTHFQRS